MTNLTGMTFGLLTVTGPAEPNGGRARVTYLCECGSTGTRRADQVANAVSCGCVRSAKASEMSSKRLIDLSGQRFGRLVVGHRIVGAGRVKWACVCDCGRATVVMAENLRSGNTNSCGCAKQERVVIRPPELRRKKNDAVKKRYKEDPKFALDMRVRAAVHKHLRSSGAKKSNRMRDLLGYTWSELERRLNKTMPVGYAWADFLAGRLHVDHIVPLSAFNFSALTDLDFRRAWALSNLQLLPSLENIKKSDSLSEPFQPSLLF